jgi:hypothetical protein
MEEKREIEKYSTHAKMPNGEKLVVKYAPEAAQKAVNYEQYMEASNYALMAIEYFEGNDTEATYQFYKAYAYECYPSNQIQEAILILLKKAF